MSFERMVDMAISEHDEKPETASVAEASSQPRYPYNLSLSLTNDELEKLGLDCSDEECEVGNYLHLHALAEVTGYSKSATQDGERHCLNLQITHLSVEDEGEENVEADEEMNEGKVYRQAGPY